MKYVVDHTGICTTSEGEHIRYYEGVPVELPKDIVAALGDHATVYGQETDATPTEDAKEPEQKDVKDKADKQVKAGETVTK